MVRCKNSPDGFCYICGRYWAVKQTLTSITGYIKQLYLAYFGMKVRNQDKSWVPHKVCKPCFNYLSSWFKGKKAALPFGIPMIWSKPENHSDDCYFCCCHVYGYNRKTRKQIFYPDNISSVIRPVPHGIDVPVPLPPAQLPVIFSESSNAEHSEVQGFSESDAPQPFSQVQLNDLISDLGLSKDAAKLLHHRLKERNLLAK